MSCLVNPQQHTQNCATSSVRYKGPMSACVWFVVCMFVCVWEGGVRKTDNGTRAVVGYPGPPSSSHVQLAPHWHFRPRPLDMQRPGGFLTGIKEPPKQHQQHQSPGTRRITNGGE
jgi:hypothetical protein